MPAVVRALFLAIVLCLAAAPIAAADTEPNNRLAEFEGPVAGGAIVAGTLQLADDVDWYGFYSASQQQLSIPVANTGGCPLRATLVASDGTGIAAVTVDPGATSTLTRTTPLGVTRFFVVLSRGCAGASYGWSIDPADALVGGPAHTQPAPTGEPNESDAQAWGPLAAGTTYGGAIETSNDVDVYTFNTLSAQQLDLEVTNAGGCQIKAVFLPEWDADHGSYAYLDPDKVWHASYTTPGAGRYLLRVTGCVGARYAFAATGSVGLTSAPPAPEATVLTTPAEGEVVPNGDVRFAWAAARGAKTYDLVVDGAPVKTALTATSATIGGLGAGPHTAAVTARNAYGATASAPRGFAMASASSGARSGKGDATLRVDLRPYAGERGTVVVSGARARRTVRQDADLRLPPGTYRVRAVPVKLRHDHGRIRRGSRAYAFGANGRIRVGPGDSAVLTVTYSTVIDRSVRNVRGRVSQATGPAQQPSAIVLRHRVGRGMLVVAPPGAHLPHGLFARVRSVRRAHGRWHVRLGRAALRDAFPALDVDETTAIGQARRARTSANDEPSGERVDLIAPAGVSCGVDPKAAPETLRGDMSLRPVVHRDLHWSLISAPHGELTVGFAGDANLHFGFPTGLQCQKDWDIVKDTVIGYFEIGPVPVAVDFTMDASLSVSVERAIEVDGHVGFGATVGVGFKGGKAWPLADGTFSPTFSGRGEARLNFAVTPKITLGTPRQLGADILSAYMSATLQASAALGDRGWALGLDFLPEAGITVLGTRGSVHKTMHVAQWPMGPADDGSTGGGGDGGSPSTPTQPTTPAPTTPAPSSLTPAGVAAPGTAFSCANDNSNIGHYVPANRYWGDNFVSAGGAVAQGRLQLGANTDGGDHRARIGIYADGPLAGVQQEVVVPVNGYGGVDFSFPRPVALTPGHRYWITATGVGDFTAYDNRAGCFIGRLDLAV